MKKKNFETNVGAVEIILNDLGKNNYKILDYGCGEGGFTNTLKSKENKVYGCDIDEGRIKKAQRIYPHIIFKTLKPNKKTPYKNNFFDCVILLGVLEHVRDEKETLKEIARIIKPGGILYIYGINKGLFGFLDAANIKFLFPKLHESMYVLFYGRNAYEKEFGNKQKGEMFGDFTSGKSWHTHYSKQDLIKLTSKQFAVQSHWYYSFFEPILRVIEFLGERINGKRINFLWNLIVWDSYISAGKLSYSFVFKCQKK